MRTPSTPRGRAAYDHLPPLEAIIRAWTEPGPRPDWHRRAQDEVRRAMPTLAHALDRYAYTGIYTGQERVAVSDIRRALDGA